MTTLWSGRCDTAPDAAACAFGASFAFDRRLDETLADLLARGRADAGFVAGPDEDVHSFVERKLVERLGHAGRRLHTGRSRNEQVSLDLRLYLRRRIPAIEQALADLVAALAAKAQEAGGALMPSFTHMRPAQPVLVAHYFLAHVAALRRDYERLAAAAREADALPLGSGAIAGTSYAV